MYTDVTGESYYLKSEDTSPNFIDSVEYQKLLPTFYKHKFLAFHTRYSTVGANSEANSHPFCEGRYLGMQNGTISNNHLNLVLNEISPCPVDSQSVFWSMNKQGVQATFDAYEGAGVFLYVDLDEKTFNIVKNGLRNLHRAKLVGIDAYIFCTDKHAIELACARATLLIEDVELVADGILHTYSMDNVLTTSPLVVKDPVYQSYDYYADWLSKQPPYKPHNKVIHLPNKTFAQNSVRSYLSNTPTYQEFVEDCSICSSPMYTTDIIYADSSSLISAGCVCCSLCVIESEQKYGYSMLPLSLAEKESL